MFDSDIPVEAEAYRKFSENEILHPADIYARNGKIESEVNSYYSIPNDIPPNPFDETIMQFGEPNLEGYFFLSDFSKSLYF